MSTTTTATALDQHVMESTPPATPQASPFISVAMPPDHFVTLNCIKHFSCMQLAKHVGVAYETISRKCRTGDIAYIVQPGTIKKKLIPEGEVRRVLMSEGIARSSK